MQAPLSHHLNSPSVHCSAVTRLADARSADCLVGEPSAGPWISACMHPYYNRLCYRVESSALRSADTWRLGKGETQPLKIWLGSWGHVLAFAPWTGVEPYQLVCLPREPSIYDMTKAFTRVPAILQIHPRSVAIETRLKTTSYLLLLTIDASAAGHALYTKNSR